MTKRGSNGHGKRQQMQEYSAGLQKREAKDGGWRVWIMSRRTGFRASRGGGDWVLYTYIGATTTTGCLWGGGRTDKKTRKSHKTVGIGWAGGLE